MTEASDSPPPLDPSFVVVAPLYRGSLGAEGKDELGGGDLLDLMNVTKLLAHLPYADTRNVFLYGESRGGVMTFMAIRDGFPANAAATFGAFTDMDAYVRSAGPQLEALSRHVEGPVEHHRKIVPALCDAEVDHTIVDLVRPQPRLVRQ